MEETMRGYGVITITVNLDDPERRFTHHLSDNLQPGDVLNVAMNLAMAAAQHPVAQELARVTAELEKTKAHLDALQESGGDE